MFIPLDKVSIPRTNFTLTVAVDTIINMDKIHEFDWIYVDKGYGEMQIEQLHLYGKNHPESGFHKKVIGVSFSEKVSVRDPYTKKKDEKDVKPFMVNNSVNLFEKGMLALDPKDNQLKEQLEGYRVKSISPTGRPTYSDENEHYVDALNLCMLGFALQYDSMIRVQLAKRIASFSALDGELANTQTTAGLSDTQRSNYLDAIDDNRNSGTIKPPTNSTQTSATNNGVRSRTVKTFGRGRSSRSGGGMVNRNIF
jgi:replicative DNA helicase